MYWDQCHWIECIWMKHTLHTFNCAWVVHPSNWLGCSQCNLIYVHIKVTGWSIGNLKIKFQRKKVLASEWQHQAMTWTNVDLSSVMSSEIHLQTISQEIPQSSIITISLNITYIIFHCNFPVANELNTQYCSTFCSHTLKGMYLVKSMPVEGSTHYISLHYSDVIMTAGTGNTVMYSVQTRYKLCLPVTGTLHQCQWNEAHVG